MRILVSKTMHDYPLKKRTIGHVLADKADDIGLLLDGFRE